MPRKKSGIRRYVDVHRPNYLGDVTDYTLSDFADAKLGLSGRLRKGKRVSWKNIETTVKYDKMESMSEKFDHYSEDSDLLPWDERDFDYINFDKPNKEEEEDLAEPIIRKSVQVAASSLCGKTYPVDLWFLIGNYIDAEDVSLFSLICHDAHRVVHTAYFWNNLYRRYYSSEATLPKLLGPNYVVCGPLRGLRTRVVRSLFYIHPQLEKRVSSVPPFSCEPESLVGSTCLVMWHKKQDRRWIFMFKMRRPGIKVHCPIMTDIIHNPEEDCFVLQVITKHYICLPTSLLGQTLCQTALSVGRAMSYHKLRLVFTSCIQSHSAVDSINTVIDPVIDVRVLHWWDPRYPCNAEVYT